MQPLLFVFLAYIMGFVAAIPIGAVQIEVVKRSLNDHFGPALIVVLGSVLCNILYGVVAFFGLAPFLRDRTVVAIFELAAAGILSILALFALRQSRSPGGRKINRGVLKSKNLSFFTGFSLAVTNPMMILWWLIGARIVTDLGLIRTFSPATSVMFICFGALGLASYSIILATVLHRVKKSISTIFLRRINFSLGMVLVFLCGYFLIRSIRILCC
jgi:threonine/homoserine/homoserine lactone efflux protein